MVPVPDGELWAEDNGSGTAVVLIHGDWTDSGIWTRLMPLLQDRYRVIRYDLRGFGRSSRPSRPFTRLEDLQAVLDHFGIQQAVVVGHSGGGGSALGLALHYPERTLAVTLVAPGIHDYPWPEDDAYFQECGSMIAAADQDGIFSVGLRTWAPGGADAEIAAMMRGAVSSWFQIGDLEKTDPQGFGLLGTVRAPAIMLLGDQEYPMVADVSRAIAARLSRCQTILVPGADHLLPLREPESVANAIAEITPRSLRARTPRTPRSFSGSIRSAPPGPAREPAFPRERGTTGEPGKIARAANPDIYQVIVHVGPEALTGEPDLPGHPPPDARPAGHPAHPARCHLEDGPAISPATVQRIACQATVSWMLHDHNGNVLDVGRRHRTPPPALRRAVRERDRYRCQAPGCQSRRTDIHHIRPWARGGKTRLPDLILLCEAHHMIVHAYRYLITPAGDGRFIFTKPDGTVLPNCPPLPETRGDITSQHTAGITAHTIIPAGLADNFDLDQTIWVSFANTRTAEEREQAFVRAA